MYTIFQSILPVLLIVFLGYALRKKDFVPKEYWEIIEALCFWVLFPSMILTTILSANFQNIRSVELISTLLGTLLSLSCLILLTTRYLLKDWKIANPQFTTIFQSSVRWHGFIAIAILINLYGEEINPIMAIVFLVLVPIIQIICLIILATYTNDQSNISTKKVILTIIQNPLIIATTLGFTIQLADHRIWSPIYQFLDILGRSALGLSLLVIGAGLNIKEALHPSKELWLGVTFKLIAWPILIIIWALYFQIDGLALSVLVVCAGVPTATNGFIFAKKYGGDASLYAATATIQTLLSFITIPFLLWFAITYLGAR